MCACVFVFVCACPRACTVCVCVCVCVCACVRARTLSYCGTYRILIFRMRSSIPQFWNIVKTFIRHSYALTMNSVMLE